jgi:hypothetical protein
MNLHASHTWYRLTLLTAAIFSQSALAAQQSSPPTPQNAAAVPVEQSPAREPTSAELSRTETIGSAMLRTFKYQEYEVRSAAEAMPEDKYNFRPAAGLFAKEKPAVGPAEVRTFAEQIKHIACANFAFSAELDGGQPPAGCDKGGPSKAAFRAELLIYLRDSFRALDASLGAINDKNKFDPISGDYATPNTRLGLAAVCVWHAADHYGQLIIYLRLNGIVPPASRPNPPEIND